MNIVVIGAQKAGTSWLFSMLQQQPRVGTAFQKEIHFFDNLHRPDFDFQAYRRPILEKFEARMQMSPDFRRYMRRCMAPATAFTDDWYRRIFTEKPENRDRLERGEQLVFLEASPNYMTIPDAGVARMSSLLGDIAPIMLVRDPLRRMISGTAMELAKRPRRYGGDEQIMAFIRKVQTAKGAYSAAIPLFRKYFPRLILIPFRHIHESPDSVLRMLEDRFGLEKLEYDRVDKKFGSRTGAMAFSDSVVNLMKTICEPEYAYLEQEFGRGFLAEI